MAAQSAALAAVDAGEPERARRHVAGDLLPALEELLPLQTVAEDEDEDELVRSPALAEGGASGIADVRTGHLRGQLEASVHATHQAVVLARMRTLLFAHLTTDAGVVATRDRTRTGTAREQLGRVPNSSSTTGPWRRRRASATSRHWPRTSSTRACSGCGACPTCSTGTCRAATSLLPPVPAQRTTS